MALEFMPAYNIEFQPMGKSGQAKEGESVFECARRLGLWISSECGGVGTCGECRVRILDGIVSQPDFSEEDFLSKQDLANGWRLSCQTFPDSDIKVQLPDGH